MTALLPVVLYPLLGILSTNQTAAIYMKVTYLCNILQHLYEGNVFVQHITQVEGRSANFFQFLSFFLMEMRVIVNAFI